MILNKKNIIHVIKITIFLFIILVFTTTSKSDHRIVNDAFLIIPGIGAEKALIGESIFNVKNKYTSNTIVVSKFNQRKNAFKDILNIKNGPKINYDVIYYFKENKTIIFAYNSFISAIIGFNTERITLDSINLKNGIDDFIFHYGNPEITIKDPIKGKIFIFIDLGIALFTNKNNESIDMYMIFKKNNK